MRTETSFSRVAFDNKEEDLSVGVIVHKSQGFFYCLRKNTSQQATFLSLFRRRRQKAFFHQTFTLTAYSARGTDGRERKEERDRETPSSEEGGLSRFRTPC